MTRRDAQVNETGEQRGIAAHDNTCESPADTAQRIYRDSPYHALRHLECSFADGVLTIAGRLPSFFMKQVAQTSIQHVVGVERVENRVEVSG
jgi:osmotically-inducible protein OsmY